ncbi:hypothetical protein FRAAL3466 [Frankia alni ACN14a]|uniref:Uncharacterized protein n=1 Tax=Frankia alni (strain DSM 45986 / CECT 9034 / ACN14a) TaxID=326424 RepID=Q0RK49_FRAAA|nr:hypothetical protein FRAAL3466 [Frankia alni ACN14a]
MAAPLPRDAVPVLPSDTRDTVQSALSAKLSIS